MISQRFSAVFSGYRIELVAAVEKWTLLTKLLLRSVMKEIRSVEILKNEEWRFRRIEQKEKKISTSFCIIFSEANP